MYIGYKYCISNTENGEGTRGCEKLICRKSRGGENDCEQISFHHSLRPPEVFFRYFMKRGMYARRFCLDTLLIYL